jgi:hypothetical protein
VLGHADLSLTSTSATIGCHAPSADLTVCLSEYTTYYVEISVIRESGEDASTAFYVATTLLERSAYDHSEIYIYSGDIFVLFVDEAGWMVNGTMAIGDTPFVGARIESPSKDLVVELRNSTVVQTFSREFKIEMSYDEYHQMLTLIDRFEFTFTSLRLVYGVEQNSMPLLEFCMCFILQKRVDLSFMALTDPAGKTGCDELCRTPETALGLDLYLNCRIHCLLPDFTGEKERCHAWRSFDAGCRIAPRVGVR